MSLHRQLAELEHEIDRFEDGLARRHGDRVRPPRAPRRREGLPPDLLLVGLVGGTGVGKSTLVNALAGADISRTSARRPTTDRVIPYLHRRRLELLENLDFVRDSLSSDIRPHEIDELENIILFDLPDIDSSERAHAAVVERVLEGLDLVVWVTSLTKYSDRLLHDWLERHARGRDVANFIFFLNRIDEVDARDGSGAAEDALANFREAVRQSLGDRDRVSDSQFFSGSAVRPEAAIPGNRVGALRAEIFRERDLREIERIKSSDRIALAANRLDHMEKELDLDARHARLDAEIEEQRRGFALVAEEDEPRAEFADRLVASSAAAEAARPIMQRMLTRWPLLPQLSFLALPLRQLGRLARLPALLLPGDDEDRSRGLPILRARLATLDLERRARESLRLDTDDIARPPLEEEEIRDFLEGLENEAVAEVRAQAQTQLESAPPDGLLVRTMRRLLIWGTLLWFPLLQPLLVDILNPEAAEASLPLRLGWRIVRILGAAHLLVSFAFVLAVYLIVMLLLQAAARRRALRSCRALEKGDWWRITLCDKLVDLFLGAARSRMQEIESERRGIEGYRSRLDAVRGELDQSR